jgi:hypothetical protein
LNDLFFLTNHAASGATLRAINFMHNATCMRWCDLYDPENRDGNFPVLFSSKPLALSGSGCRTSGIHSV